MKDITSKMSVSYENVTKWLYAGGESAMCRLHIPFESLVADRHNCLGCNFAESSGQILDFLAREVRDPRTEVNDVMTDLMMKLYLMIERIYVVFDIIELQDEYRFRHFGIFKNIHKWANFIKHPKAFLFVHHPRFLIENDEIFRKEDYDVVIDQEFVNRYYSGPDNNKSLLDTLKNKIRVAVLFPDPEVFVEEFCRATIKFVEMIQENRIFVEILSSRTTYERYYSDLDKKTKEA